MVVKIDTAPPRGMKDVLPPEVELRDRASATILATYKRYGFRRAERPQKGRFRQFTQCDIDVLGVASEIAEVELILATSAALIALGLERPRIRVNDRRILSAMATHCGVDAARHGEFFITLDKLD